MQGVWCLGLGWGFFPLQPAGGHPVKTCDVCMQPKQAIFSYCFRIVLPLASTLTPLNGQPLGSTVLTNCLI